MEISDALSLLDSLHLGFRQRYLDYETLTAQARAWAERFPDLVRLRSIGKSLEGRDLWLLTIGPDPDRVRPSVWVDGNMHAGELCGSSAALAIAEDVIRLHLASASSPESHARDGAPNLPPRVRASAAKVLFHVLPRMCPDGAEAVLHEGRWVRSNPRDRRHERHQVPRWVARDVDGDGLSLAMRKRDPGGEFVESAEIPGLMLPRTFEDEGPFYKLYPEGVIEPFDGVTIPVPNYLSDNDTDLNRNFPWSWAPEHEQFGAGAFAASEPESRAVVEFVGEHPEIFAWLNLHTFGGVFIRPLGDAPDKKMNPDDLALFRAIGAFSESITGYPMVSGFEEFLYSPDTPIRGDLSAFAYHQRGTIGYVCELWDLFAQAGLERKKPFIANYDSLSRDDLLKVARWDRDHNQSRVTRPWRTFQHPQLGEVEVGGRDARVGIQNPPFERIAEVCAKQSAAFLRVAALAPDIVLSTPTVTALGEDLFRVEVTVENHGYLPSYVLSSAKSLPWNQPLLAEVVTEGAAALVSPTEARCDVGHLAGWGHGQDAAYLLLQHSHNGSSSRKLTWVVSRATANASSPAAVGAGLVTIRVRGARTGLIERRIELPGR
ncbi:M14 family metallopeptidase [Pendulispora albinea]|uniref:M14 family metallopeptidase n=1 Tax=Pendulispora albinea TaxID=2741071 RepID=A0ABZ2LLZ2_9BACT